MSRTKETRTSDVDVAGVLALAIPAIVLFTAMMWLGYYVTQHGEPPALWAFAQSVRGHATGFAWALTNAGYAQVLAPLYLVCIVIAILSPRWRLPILFVLAVALLCWRADDALQHYFARPRRDDWIIRHEHAFSYPSSHAAISAGFYFLSGLVLLRSRLPAWLRTSAFILLAALTAGIMWSRLALGAHYPTDVLGGALLAAAVILLGVALLKTAGRRLFER